jgi:uridine phosphorylase
LKLTLWLYFSYISRVIYYKIWKLIVDDIERGLIDMEIHGVMHHIQLKKGDVGRYVLLPGDPGRCASIAAHFDRAEKVAQSREYTTYSGYLEGVMVSVVSTGIGCPSTAIAVEELAAIGADTFIRVGTSGAMQKYIQVGDLVITSAAVRDEGTTPQYMPIEFPAVANQDITLALLEAARRLGVRHHVGITQTKDSFYGQRQPERMPVAETLLTRWKAWIAGGVLCSEMEAASIFVVSSILKKRAGGIMLVVANQELPPLDEEEHARRITLDTLISTAVEAVKILINKDQANSAQG